MFQPHPWIQRWACSRSWAVAPVLQYFRALRGDYANIKKKTEKQAISEKQATALIDTPRPKSNLAYAAVCGRAVRAVKILTRAYTSEVYKITFLFLGVGSVWRFLEFLLEVSNIEPINRSNRPFPSYMKGGHFRALSTSFEKTCMRQIHSL